MTSNRIQGSPQESGASEKALENIRGAIRTLVELAQSPEERERIIHALEEIKKGSTTEAARIFDELLRRSTAEAQTEPAEAAETARQLGALAYFEDTNSSLAAYRKAVELDPDDTWSWIFLGRIEEQAGNLGTATEALGGR